MACIELEKAELSNLIIMIFAEGTVLMPRSWFHLYRHKSYIPIGNCTEFIKGWLDQGAGIVYCTSRKGKQAQDMASLLKLYGFPGDKLYFRCKGEKYKNLVETVLPAVLIEDNCKSIGGSWQMCITNVAPQIKEKIKSIVVDEFKGIDNLPQNILILKNSK